MAKLLTAGLPGNRTLWVSDLDAYMAQQNRLCPWSPASGSAWMYGSYGIFDLAPTGVRGALRREMQVKTGFGGSYAEALANAESYEFEGFVGNIGSWARATGYWTDGIFTPNFYQVQLLRWRFRFLMPHTGQIRLRYRSRAGLYPRYPVVPTNFIIEPTWLHHSVGYTLPQLSDTSPPRPKDTGGSSYCAVRMVPADSNKDLDFSSSGYSVTDCEANIVATPVTITGLRAIGDLVRETTATLTIEPAAEDATGGGATAEFRQGADGLFYPVLTNPGSGWTRMPLVKVNDVEVTRGYYLILAGGVVSEVNLITGGTWNFEPDVLYIPTPWLGNSTIRRMHLARVVVDDETDESITWSGAIPEGYDPNDIDTWPTTDWAELPTPGIVDSTPVGDPGESDTLRGDFFYITQPACDLVWEEE